MKAVLVLIAALAALIGISYTVQRAAHPDKYEKTKEVKPKEVDKPTLSPGSVVTVTTAKGVFKFVLYEKDMPVSCTNFISLASKGFYKGLKFHRVEDWVVQGGDPKGDGTGGSGTTIQLEVKPGLGFERAYMVGMARRGEPNSASSQWFVTKLPAPHIQQSGPYACFGQVFEGSDVVDKLKVGDAIKDLCLSTATPKDLKLIKEIQSRPINSMPTAPLPQPIPRTPAATTEPKSQT